MSYYDDYDNYDDKEFLEFDHSYCPYYRQNPMQFMFPYGFLPYSQEQQGYRAPAQGGPSSGPPSGPPPSKLPKQKPLAAGVKAVDPGAIRPCRFRFVYLWMRNGRSFWAWLVFVGPRSVAGWRWNGFMWVYFGVDLKQIQSFECV